MGRWWKSLLLATGVVAAVACSQQPENQEEDGATFVPERLDYVIVPPSLSGGAAEDAIFQGASAPVVLFANRHGGTYYGGWDNAATNRSSIISGTRTVSGWTGGDAGWASLMTCLRDQFARWNITVTDQDPGSVPHFEVVIGGHPGQIGMGNGVGGVAPMAGDCSIVQNAIVYTFSSALGNSPQLSCEVAAQEVGHAFGMDHEYLCKDPMTYLSGCGAKTFQDQLVSCGEWSPRPCQCSSKQNSVAFMTQRFGLASGTPTPTPTPTPAPPSGEVPPAVLAVSPAHDAWLAGNSTVTVSADVDDADGDLTSVVLWWWRDGAWKPFDCAAPPSYVACTEENGTYTWSFQVGTGTRWWLVRAKDAGGHQVDSQMRRANFQ